MKKKISTFFMSILIILTGVFVLSACDCNEDDSNAVIVGISAELVNDKYEMVDNTITVEYGSKVNLRYNDFKVIALLDNGKTKELPKKYGNSDGYTFQSSIPQSYDQTPVNNYSIVISYGDLEEIVITVKVTKADFSGSLNWNYSEPYIYNGEEKTVEIVDLPEGVTVVYEGVTSATNAGNYTCTAIFTCTNSSNYKEIPNKTLDWTIAPAQINVSTVEMVEKIYNETEQEAEIATATLPSNVVVKEITGETSATNVGDYTVTIDFSIIGEDADNYTIDAITTTWSIVKGTYIVHGGVEIEGLSSFVYNGEAKSIVLDYTNLDANVRVVGTPTGLTATNAGEYEVVVNLEYVGNNSNYNINAGTITLDWEIEKASLTITAKDHSITYGDVLSYNGTYEPVGFVGVDDITVLKGELVYDCNYEQFDSVGSYDIEISGYTADNYDITYEIGTLVVGKKTLTVRPNDVIIEYNSVLEYNNVQIEGFVGTDTLAVLTGTPEFSCDYTVGSPVKDGGYVISVSGYSADNYDIVYETGVLTVTKSTVNVDSIRLVDNEFVYNGIVQTVEVDESSVPFGVSVANLKMDRNNRQTKNVNTYTAVVSLIYFDTVNYESIPDISLTWKIVKATVDISSYNVISNTLEYNGKTQYLSFTELPAGAQMIDISGDRGKDANLYHCSVTIACSDKSNYNDFTEVKTFDWRIAPKELTITANNHTIEYGMPGANAGVVYSGFVAGEDISVFGGQIIYSYKKIGSGNYIAGSDKGTYIININGSTLYNNNYDITYINGQLTVIAKVVDLEDYVGVWPSSATREYNPQSAFVPKLTNVPDGVIATYTYTINGGSGGTVTAPIDIGSYIATVEFTVKNNNFELINYYGVEGFAFEITKKVVNSSTLVWTYYDGSEIEYSSHSIKPTYANSVAGIDVDYTYYKQNDSLEYDVLPDDASITDIGKYKVVATLEYDESKFEFVSPVITEVTYSIVKISVTATALNWNVETVLDRKEDNAIYHSAEVSHTGGYITITLSRNEYLQVEYLNGEEFSTTAPKFIEKGEYTVVARVSIKDEYADTYKLSTGGDYYTYNLTLGISQIIFNTLKVDNTDYELEELIDKTNMVRKDSKFYYSIRSFYALVRVNYSGEYGWTVVENGFEFTDYYYNDNRYTFFVIDRSINPNLEMYTTDTGVIYELTFDTYLIETITYGSEDDVLSKAKSSGVVYELGMTEESFEITLDAESLALFDECMFRYMIIDSEGEWLDPVDIEGNSLVFDNLESIYSIMILVAFDDTTNYQITQFVLIPPTHVKGYTVTSVEFNKNETIIDEYGLGGWSKSICNGVVTGFTVHLKDEYQEDNYTVEYFSNKEHTLPVDFTNLDEAYIIYFVVYNNNSQEVEYGEFAMYHAFVPDNLPICMNAIEPDNNNPIEYIVSVETNTISLNYTFVENSEITISQTYNGEETITLQDGSQVVNYVLTISYNGVDYIFEMPITVICSLNVLDCFEQQYKDSLYYPVTYEVTNEETGEEEIKTYQIQRDYGSRINYIDLTSEYDNKTVLQFTSILTNLEFPFAENYQIVSREIVEMFDRFYIKLSIEDMASVDGVSPLALPKSATYYFIELKVKEVDCLEFQVNAVGTTDVSLDNNDFEEVEYNEETYLVVKLSTSIDDDISERVNIKNFETNLTYRIYNNKTTIQDWSNFTINETSLNLNETYKGRCCVIDFDNNSKYGGVIIFFANSDGSVAPIGV